MSCDREFGTSTLDDYELEILAWYDERRLPSDVEPFQQSCDIALQRSLLDRIQRSKGLVRRSIEIAENPNPMRTRPIAEIEVLSRAPDIVGMGPEERDDVRFGAPQRRRLEPGRRRNV